MDLIQSSILMVHIHPSKIGWIKLDSLIHLGN